MTRVLARSAVTRQTIRAHRAGAAGACTPSTLRWPPCAAPVGRGASPAVSIHAWLRERGVRWGGEVRQGSPSPPVWYGACYRHWPQQVREKIAGGFLVVGDRSRKKGEDV